ncbi:MAG: hypothetical protein AMQ22_01770 [Candidatus Methanofastidiosum methylothiophilum]|uniref:Uncharacterized protein n=1 Tax=Candidatus Methanofastidiosum methylothiophilum TaxID=1705564 RepID=A0A150IVF4_9EURY|nr:MAG: hypothetical protein AMQ22_01770 [Candidatus Methanofastidiosum methylthiophilus]
MKKIICVISANHLVWNICGTMYVKIVCISIMIVKDAQIIVEK